ncbi:MAG: hypothetical protein CMI79_03745 [Candidatus Pelagibacter sp.]|nr:hypothetical protein [Candidatus Pelagibacter sp.]
MDIHKDMEDLVLECPHCNNIIIVNRKDINCAIFRHAILKETGKQIDPHSNKEVCDELVKTNKVFGCAKPFKLVKVDSLNYIAEKCHYI